MRCIGCGAELSIEDGSSSEAHSLLGRQIGPYRITESISKNARSTLYKGTHVELQRSVAIKVLGDELAKDAHAKSRMAREGRALARISHPYVVVVHEAGEVDGRPFLAMSFHEGITLRQRMDRAHAEPSGRIGVPQAVGIARALAAALSAIHEQGVLHRDLKPENVVFPSDGGMKLVDFGLARLDDRPALGALDERTLTAPGAVLGTLPYLAPEQLLGERVDHRADLWALGVVLFEMLSGTTPFQTHERGLVASILEHGPKRLETVIPAALPAPLVTLVHRLLTRSPSERPASAHEVETLLVAAFPAQIAPEMESVGDPIEAGDVVGERMRLTQRIGQGSSGMVWRADHLVLGTACAIKFLSEDLALVPRARSRFLEEARTLAKLDNPHIVRVLDAGTHRGRPYLAMELLEGETLEAKLVRTTIAMDNERAIGVLREIAEGLDAAHRVGVVHRDLQPVNVFAARAKGAVTMKILDFGISKSVGDSDGSTHFGTVGAPYYLSPEQIRPTDRVDHHTDLWSLGIIAHRVLTNTLPFDGPNVTSVCEEIVSGRVPSFTRASKRLPAEADPWLQRALAHDPNERFASAGEMIDRLAEILSSAPQDEDSAVGPPPSELEPPTVPVRASTTGRSSGGLRGSAPPGTAGPVSLSQAPRLSPLALVGIALVLVLVGLIGVLVGSWALSLQ